VTHLRAENSTVFREPKIRLRAPKEFCQIPGIMNDVSSSQSQPQDHPAFPRKPSQSQDQISADLKHYRLFMFLLGVYVLVTLAGQTFLKLDNSTNDILNIVDHGVCVIFFIDFWLNLYCAQNKWDYLKWGWLDLLSSLPMIGLARAGRVARVIRVLRALRSIRLIRVIANHFIDRRQDSTLFTIALVSILLVLFSSIAMLQFETTKESNIRTPEDAIWWAFATVTTVGYGDKFPVTTEGRIVAAVVMVAGVGMFGSFTGLVASWLLSPSKKDDEQDLELAR
jgi:voltage-gated potassium channel